MCTFHAHHRNLVRRCPSSKLSAALAEAGPEEEKEDEEKLGRGVLLSTVLSVTAASWSAVVAPSCIFRSRERSI